MNETDPFYESCLTLRSVPVPAFLAKSVSDWVLPITSINEDRLLSIMGLSAAERSQIEGLRAEGASRGKDGPSLTEQQMSTLAIDRLTANPPPEVGSLQRRTSHRLLRP